MPSAQVKSAVLLAGLRASGTTTVVEPEPTRDHTERALAAFGVAGRSADVPGGSTVTGGAALRGGLALRVPGDPSASAFLGVAAAGLPGSALDLTTSASTRRAPPCSTCCAGPAPRST